MQKLTLLFATILMSISLISQTSQAFKYQAVVRDNSGEIIANQEVSFRFSIHDSIASGIILYQESHMELTNAYGVVNIQIGTGEPETGLWSDIEWGQNEKFMEVELDTAGGNTYISMGTTQLLAVPYALYAESTGDTSRWRKNDENVYYQDGKVGIGTDSPNVMLDVVSPNEDEASRMYLRNSDGSDYIFFYSGRAGASPLDPAIIWPVGKAMRLASFGTQIIERMRISNIGNVGIGTDAPDESAKLEVNSNSMGFLLPKMTGEQISNIDNPADGLQVYNTENGKLFIFVEIDGIWKELSYGPETIPVNAVFEIGTGGLCSNIYINGTYGVAKVIGPSEFVTIEIDVIFLGEYIVSSDTINGYSFYSAGVFDTPGIQSVALNGNGMPLSDQTDNFTITASNNGSTCTFEIIVEIISPDCPAQFLDLRDGKSYDAIQIGNQCWMAENLNVGLEIDSDEYQTSNDTIEKYCYNNSSGNCETYGGLYSWYEMMQYSNIPSVQGICPDGWHIPGTVEWGILENTIVTLYGGEYLVGGHMKETGILHWLDPNHEATNYSGFTALPGGASRYTLGGYFENIQEGGYFWSSNETTLNNATYIKLHYTHGKMDYEWIDKYNGSSVRCVKD